MAQAFPIPSGGKGRVYSLRWCWDQMALGPVTEHSLASRQPIRVRPKVGGERGRKRIPSPAEHSSTAASGPGQRSVARGVESGFHVPLRAPPLEGYSNHCSELSLLNTEGATAAIASTRRKCSLQTSATLHLLLTKAPIVTHGENPNLKGQMLIRLLVTRDHTNPTTRHFQVCIFGGSTGFCA